MKGQTEQEREREHGREREGAGRQVAACCCGNQLVILMGQSVCVRVWVCEQRPSDNNVPSAR